MNESIDKFLLEVAKESDRIVNESIILYFNPTPGDTEKLHNNEIKMTEIHNFSKMFTLKRDYPDNHGEVFADFKIFCEYLDRFDLSYVDVYNLVLYFIQKNVRSGILASQSLLVDLKQIDSSGYSEDVIDFVKYLIVEDRLQEFMNRKVLVTDKEIKAKELISSFIIDLEPYYTLTKTINEVYISKMDSYDEEDIKKIEAYLIDSGVSDKSRTCFMKVVNKNYSKRVSNKRVTSGLYQVPNSTEVMSTKEYKQLEKEIRKIYNSKKRELLVDITYDEMLELASKMVSAKYSDKDIIDFFNVAMNNQERIVDIAYFVKYYDKYKFYIEPDRMEMIETYLGEMMISSDEDYSFWKEEVLSLLKSCSDHFNNKYDYELELVKR